MEEDLNVQKLILNYLNDPGNEVFAALVHQFREQSSANETYFQELSTIWHAATKTKPLYEADLNTSVGKLRAKLSDQVEKIPERSFGFLGKVAAIVIVSAAAFWIYTSQDAVEYIVKQTTDRVDSLILEDSTKIILSKNTTVSYPDRFEGDSREISLQHGQAFFKVSKDPKRPFNIIIGQSKVTVLGTTFNIHFAKDFINLAVTTGKVRFSPRSGHQSSVLTAGQALEYNLVNQQVNKVTGANSSSWLTRELVFVDMPLDKVCEDLSTHYGVEIILTGKRIHAQKFNARFKDRSLDEILLVLKQTYKIKIEKTSNDLITITNF